MNESAEVLLWGCRIGVVSREGDAPSVKFAYDAEFRDFGIEPSPVTMPVAANISYLMDRSGEWRLAPAYDECYAYNPTGALTSRHQMSIAGKRSGITDDDLVASARIAGLSEKETRRVIGEVRVAVKEWKTFAAEAGVREELVPVIATQLGIDA